MIISRKVILQYTTIWNRSFHIPENNGLETLIIKFLSKNEKCEKDWKSKKTNGKPLIMNLIMIEQWNSWSSMIIEWYSAKNQRISVATNSQIFGKNKFFWQKICQKNVFADFLPKPPNFFGISTNLSKNIAKFCQIAKTRQKSIFSFYFLAVFWWIDIFILNYIL